MKKKRFKQGAALTLSFALILGMIPAVIKPLEVRAATTNVVPTISQFATKKELMTNYDLTNSQDATVQKVIFGMNGKTGADQKPQEWKIAGKDTGINEDNIVLFAATPLKSDVAFNDVTGTKDYDSDWKCTYDSAPSTVYANHYGGSDLRQTISDFLKGESYFSSAEQKLMNATTITTKDTYNSKNYTTTDKLYAAYGDNLVDQYITVGTNSADSLNGGLKIDIGNCGNSNFWLRTPNDLNNFIALWVKPGHYVSDSNVSLKYYAVVPAFDLDLSSVIFASAASAATAGSMTLGDAFTLRYASAGKETASINEEGSKVGITNAADGMYLVVQNSTGAYKKALTNATTSVKASDIDGIEDFYNCQVWLESTDATSRITTATVPITKAEPTTTDITSVAITDITVPTVSSNLDTTAACATAGVSSTTPAVTWTPSVTTAGYNTAYTASVVLTADAYYQFTDSTTATINGNTATSVTKNEADRTLTVTYAFGATEKDKLTSITAPSPVTVANGTGYEAMNLPSTVGIVTEGNTVTTAAVQWDTTTPVSGNYDPFVLTEQSVTLKGTVTCPTDINSNNVILSTTITITISAAGIVGAPTFNPVEGTYTSNQMVTFTSTTDGATIYYTTDGSAPSITSSVYSTPISVTGVAGESNTTTIKAIAVKNEMQTSSISSATYVIEIPAPAPTTYAVIVNNGSGDGSYEKDATVTITAATAPSGKVFDKWEVVSGTVTLGSTTNTTTTFNMPEEAVEVTATYKDAPVEPTPTPDPTVTITAGAGGTHQIGSDENLQIICSGALTGLTGIYVDGVLVDSSNYNFKSGSTILTFTPAYLNSLSVGTHSVRFQYNNTYADTTFVITAADSTTTNPSKYEVPKTGDKTPIVWLSVVAMISGMGVIYFGRKKRNVRK